MLNNSVSNANAYVEYRRDMLSEQRHSLHQQPGLKQKNVKSKPFWKNVYYLFFL